MEKITEYNIIINNYCRLSAIIRQTWNAELMYLVRNKRVIGKKPSCKHVDILILL